MACAVLIAGTGALLVSPSLRTRFGFSTPVAAAYTVGDRIDVPVDLYDSSPATVLIFARSTCGACQRAKLQFAAVVARLRAVAPVTLGLVTTGARTSDEWAYAQAIGLRETELKTISLEHLRLRVVPTIVVVDRAGVIRYAFEGAPSTAQQDDLLRTAAELVRPR